ncbi:MAG: TonB family protein [Proteobacteria bacterium]|nr:MAG: TonB family protein [Pseudomonadota bacterium]
MAFQDTLAELRQDPSVAKLEAGQRLSSAGQTARKTERSLVTSKVATGSGGINTAALSRDTGSTRLAARSIEQVKSPVKAESAGDARSAAKNKLAGRTDEEIQLIFDRNKTAIYNLYNRALRTNPSLQGKVVVKLTIAPNGQVTDIRVVSSELDDNDLERKLTLRIKRFDFGAKAVAGTTISYTMDFFPS